MSNGMRIEPSCERISYAPGAGPNSGEVVTVGGIGAGEVASVAGVVAFAVDAAVAEVVTVAGTVVLAGTVAGAASANKMIRDITTRG
jgi:hypothetical protein